MQSASADEHLVLPSYERLAVTSAADALPLRVLDNFVLFITDVSSGAMFLAGLQQLTNGPLTVVIGQASPKALLEGSQCFAP